jgi:uncharacterized membrane protein
MARGQAYPEGATRRDGRGAAHVMYALYAASVVTALPMLAGVVVAYLGRADARGTIYRSHLDWGIRTFWWTLLFTVIGLVLTLILIGWVILGALWLWFVYRTVRGWLRLIDERPAPGHVGPG